jgi:hypothetical protein
MSDKTPMFDEHSPMLLGTPMPVVSQKILSPTADGTPRVFINSAEFSGAGMDVFMDVGVVPIESMGAAAEQFKRDPSAPAKIEFHISFRFGMSLQSAAMIHQRLTQFLQRASLMAEQQISQHSQPPAPSEG